MKKDKILFFIGIFAFVAVFVYLLCSTGTLFVTKEGSFNTYKCDYKSMKMNTKIITNLDGKEISIEGELFSYITDPLTVRDSDGNVLGYAGDSYGYVTQDDHGIYIGTEFDVNMCGKFSIFRNVYHIKNEKEEVVAIAKFNAVDTYGVVYDMENKAIATYSSLPFANDYKVSIYDNDICSDMSILMIMASYKSDVVADQRNSSKNN